MRVKHKKIYIIYILAGSVLVFITSLAAHYIAIDESNIGARDTIKHIPSIASIRDHQLNLMIDLAALYANLAKRDVNVSSFIKTCVSDYTIPLFYVLIDSSNNNDCFMRVGVGRLAAFIGSRYNFKFIVPALGAIGIGLVKEGVEVENDICNCILSLNDSVVSVFYSKDFVVRLRSVIDSLIRIATVKSGVYKENELSDTNLIHREEDFFCILASLKISRCSKSELLSIWYLPLDE